MIFAFDAREDLFDVVEAAHQARAQVEAARGVNGAAGPGLMDGVKTRTEDVIHERLERDTAPPLLALEPRSHVVVHGQRRAHM